SYTEGKGNKVADALSRKYTGVIEHPKKLSKSYENDFSSLYSEWRAREVVTLTIHSLWKERIGEAQKKDDQLPGRIGKGGYHCKNGFVYMKDK
ncbi:hypothetical protein Q8G71_34305, partial [Klebsiella pneumoniae]